MSNITKTTNRTQKKAFSEEALNELLGQKWSIVSQGSLDLRRQSESDLCRITQALKAVTPQKEPAEKGANWPDLTTVNQWIEINVRDGITITKYFPKNDVVLKNMDSGHVIPSLVYRRFFFRCDIPSEYSWARSKKVQRTRGGIGIQRLTPEDFRLTVAKETEGHAVCGTDVRPRPQSRGGCNCPCCTAQTKRLQAAGTAFL